MISVIDIKKYKQGNQQKQQYKNIPFVNQIFFALKDFYTIPLFSRNKPPNEWYPIFIHYSCGTFDPYMAGPYNSGPRDPKHKLFEPWTDCNGIEKTKQMIERTKYLLKERDYINKPRYSSNEYLLSTHFVITREYINSKDIVIGFFNMLDKAYKRFLIKDVNRLCKFLQIDTQVIIDGQLFWLDNNSGLEKIINELITDAINIPIQNEHILEFLVAFREQEKIHMFHVSD